MNYPPIAHQLARLCTVAALSVSLGCSPQSYTALRVGINAWPGYEFLYLAQEKGFYRAEGVEVQLIEFPSLADCRRAYERGQIDAMGTTVVEVLQVREHSARSPQIVRVVDASAGSDVILVRPDRQNATDLRGARVGVELASLGVYVLARGLEAQGLNLSDIRMVSADQSSMEEAFRTGELDAVVTYPPTSIKLLREGNARAVFSTLDIPQEVLDVIAVEAEINAQRPQDVAKFLRAFNRAMVYTKSAPAESYRIMAAREGITPSEFAAALADGIREVTAAEQAAYLKAGGALARVIDASDRILRETGQITGPNRRAGIIQTNFLE